MILGTGLYNVYRTSSADEKEIITKFGPAWVYGLDVGAISKSLKAFVLLRHGRTHSLPPHLINYRANIAAAKMIGADYILATSSVGSLSKKYSSGEYVVLDQFIDATKSRPFTFFGDIKEKFAHTDMTEPFSAKLREALIKSLRKNKVPRFHQRGTYVCTEGPRFETAAEIEMYRRAGAHVVGMTLVPEVVLANELSIPYGSLSKITNMAAGIQKKVSQEEVVQVMDKSIPEMKKILDDSLRELVA
jgi:5'-methylthioadenosine phosphorylase